MLKTIKVKKQLRLDELIKYVWDNSIFPSHFESHAGFKVHFDSRAGIKIDNDYVHSDVAVFTVEVEEEITEDTVFDQLVNVDFNGTVRVVERSYIGEYSKTRTKSIYALIKDKLELIWERDDSEV